MEPGSTPAVTISELEAAIAEIAEVRAARIVASSDGIIEEIHVLGLPGKAPKQLVRDVESALMAGYGIAVDRRKISVAQIGIAGERPVAAVVPVAPMRAVPEPVSAEDHESDAEPRIVVTGARVRLSGLDVDMGSVKTAVRVSLEAGDLEYMGEASGPAGVKTRLRMVAEATLRAIEHLPEVEDGYAVEDVQIAALGGRQVAVCSIVTVTAEGEEALSGSALVRNTAESAAVRATLDALNRRIGL